MPQVVTTQYREKRTVITAGCDHRRMAEEGQGVVRRRRRSGRHRSSEPPPLEPPSLRDELKYNFRALMAVPLLSLMAILWGADAALDDGRGWGHRLLGVSAVASGVLFGTSLWLYLSPGPLATHEWRVSPGRRRLGYAFRHAWVWVLLATAAVSLWAKVTG